MKIRVTPEILLRQLVSYVDPVYPEQAQKENLGGTVTLAVTVDEGGKVITAKTPRRRSIVPPGSGGRGKAVEVETPPSPWATH